MARSTQSSFPLTVGFKSRKAAQIAAFFAGKNNQKIEKLALAKLIYLAERDFISKYNHPMLYDELFSLPHGPICSGTLNGINGKLDEKVWIRFIVLQGKEVKSVNKFTREDYDEISEAEWEILESIWKKFGGKTSAQLRNYTHKHCPEYTEVDEGCCLRISYKDLFKALGEPNPDELEEEINAYRRMENLLG